MSKKCASVALLVLSFSLGNFFVAQPASAETDNSPFARNYGGNYRGFWINTMQPPSSNSFRLDLSSSTTSIPANAINNFHPVTIDVNGQSMEVTTSSKLTPAQAVAVMQILCGGSQTIKLASSGTASGGSIVLTPSNSRQLASLEIPSGVMVTDLIGEKNSALTITDDSAANNLITNTPVVSIDTTAPVSLTNNSAVVVSSTDKKPASVSLTDTASSATAITVGTKGLGSSGDVSLVNTGKDAGISINGNVSGGKITLTSTGSGKVIINGAVKGSGVTLSGGEIKGTGPITSPVLNVSLGQSTPSAVHTVDLTGNNAVGTLNVNGSPASSVNKAVNNVNFNNGTTPLTVGNLSNINNFNLNSKGSVNVSKPMTAQGINISGTNINIDAPITSTGSVDLTTNGYDTGTNHVIEGSGAITAANLKVALVGSSANKTRTANLSGNNAIANMSVVGSSAPHAINNVNLNNGSTDLTVNSLSNINNFTLVIAGHKWTITAPGKYPQVGFVNPPAQTFQFNSSVVPWTALPLLFVFLDQKSDYTY